VTYILSITIRFFGVTIVCIPNLNVIGHYLVVHVTDNIGKNRTCSRLEEGHKLPLGTRESEL
jgi:hypothetical protein